MISTRWLGRMDYKEALAMQESLVQERCRVMDDPSFKSDASDILLLLEHEPVYTMGRTPDRSSLRDPVQLPHPVVSINRGGQATYHGPGQLVGYPILDLKKYGCDLHRYLRAMEEILIETLLETGVSAQRREGLTGVWVGMRKIASIGVGVRRWVTMHGFALNVCGDLSPFGHITPCGITNIEMTSIELETGRETGVMEIASQIAERFPARLDELLRIG